MVDTLRVSVNELARVDDLRLRSSAKEGLPPVARSKGSVQYTVAAELTLSRDGGHPSMVG